MRIQQTDGRWMRPLACSVVAATIAFGNANFGLAQGEPGKEGADAKEQVRRVLRQLEEKASKFTDRMTLKETDRLRGNAVVQHSVTQEKVFSGWYLASSEPLAETVQYDGITRFSRPYAEGHNSKYKFVLVKDDGAKGWSVASLKLKDPSRPFSTMGDTIPGMYSLMHFRFQGMTLDKVLDLAGSKVTRNPDGSMKVDIDTRGTNGFGLSGHLTLDPTAWWCVKEYVARSKAEAVENEDSGKFEYKKQADGFPLLNRLTERTVMSMKGVQLFDIDRVLEHESALVNAIDESDFSLTAFGLSEPAGAAIKQPTTYLWFYIGGGACLLLSVLIAWVVRRRARLAKSEGVS